MEVALSPPPVSRNAAFAALRRLFWPVARLALRAGLKYADLDALLRELLAQAGTTELASRSPSPAAAASSAPPAGRVNLSALSVLTGLHRKELTRLCALREPGGEGTAGRDGLPSDTASTASQVLMCWARDVAADPALASLTLAAYTERARGWITDVHPRAALDELLRLGLVRVAGVADERVELVASRFVPSAPGDDRLRLMADNVGAHLEAGLHNSLPSRADAPVLLEQALWGDGLSPEDCLAVAALARGQWDEAHRVLYDAIAAAPEVVPAPGPSATRPHRIHIGMYVHIQALEPEKELS